jgi:3-hydroxybutyryl-CoA dehydrogenase
MTEIIEPIENYALSKATMPMALFSEVGIVGCGMVGRYLSILAASHGIDVVFIDVAEDGIPVIMTRIEEELDKRIARWGMTTSDKKAIVSKIKGSVDYNSLKDCNIVIETIKSTSAEDTLMFRKEIFKKIEEVVSPKTIIATSSSTQVITELSTEITHPERCVSLHFSIASPDANIVEVVRGLQTTDHIYHRALKFIKILDKVAIPVIESPGLISVRLFIPLLNEACNILMEGVGLKEDIDETSRQSLGMSLGPFELADKVGLDKVLKWMDNLYAEFGYTRYKASPMIKKLVRAHKLGRATGQGFYEYDDKGMKKGVKIF